MSHTRSQKINSPGDARTGAKAANPAADTASTDSALLATLVSASGRGDRAAFAELYDRSSSRLFGLIRTIVVDRSIAEDVLQETFISIWRKASQYDASLSQPLAWMMLIGRGKAIDTLRSRGAAAAAIERWTRLHPVGSRGMTEIPVRDEGLSAKAQRALSDLPSEQAEAITLAFHAGLTSAEIALHRDAPLGTIKTRIRLGMMKLRDTFACPVEVPA